MQNASLSEMLQTLKARKPSSAAQRMLKSALIGAIFSNMKKPPFDSKEVVTVVDGNHKTITTATGKNVIIRSLPDQ